MRTTNDQPDVQERRKKMQAIEDRSGVLPEIDEDGFLKKEGAWTKDVAQLMAQDIVHEALTEDHWKVINYMRHYYSEFRTIPSVRKLSRDTGLSLRELKMLFPDRVTIDACRMAGIPKHVITAFHYTPY
jgi:TusE/DsrC/DsvC family sulfur relay protein